MQSNYRTHPLTGARLEPIGRFRGRLVWPILGGSEGAVETGNAAGTGAAPGGAAPTPGAQQTDAQQTGAPQPAGERPAPATTADELVAKHSAADLAAMLLATRTEAGDNRADRNSERERAEAAAQAAAQAEAQRKELLDALRPGLKALGVELPGGTDPLDPNVLTSKLQEATTVNEQQSVALKTAQLELGVLRAVADKSLVEQFGGPLNAERLLDSRGFAATLAQLDPGAEDFGAKVVAAMKDAATRDESFRTGRAPGRAGVQLNGGTGEQQQNRSPRGLADAVGAALNH